MPPSPNGVEKGIYAEEGIDLTIFEGGGSGPDKGAKDLTKKQWVDSPDLLDSRPRRARHQA